MHHTVRQHIFSHTELNRLEGEEVCKSCLMWSSKPWQVCKAPLLESHRYSTHTRTHTEFKHTYKHTHYRFTACCAPSLFFLLSHLNQLCQNRTLCTSHCSSTVKYYHLVWCLLLQLPLKQTNTPEAFQLPSFLDVGHFSWCSRAASSSEWAGSCSAGCTGTLQ